MCFPSSFNNILEINAPTIIIDSFIGTGKKKLKENKAGPERNQSNHKLYNKNFRDGIFYMLCYFKKKRMTLPKPVIFCISKYIQTSHINIISEIDTLFPSNLKQIENKLYVKGGMFLLRLKKETLHKNNLVQINMKYKNAIDNKKYEISSLYGFDIFEKVDYFSDEKIEKALGLYYMAKYNRILMKYCNKESKTKNKFIEKMFINNRMDDMNKIIENFFGAHFHDEINSQNYNNI